MRISLPLAAALAVALNAPAGAQVLTLDEARSLALDRQPVLSALEHSARAAQDASLADNALPDPRLKLGALNFPVSGFPGARDDMTQVGIAWEQSFPGGNKRRLRGDRAQAEAGQLFAETHSLMQTIERDVGFAWVDAWAAAAAERLSIELVREYGHAQELARLGMVSGKSSPGDVLATRQLLSLTTDRRLELASQAARARGALQRWAPQSAGRTLPDELPEFPVPAPLETLRAGLTSHPQHVMQALAQGVAEAEAALARESAKPDRTVEVGYYARSGDRSDMLMFQISFELPLYSGRKQDRQLEAKLRLVERARDLRADHLRELRAGLDAAYVEWQLAGERLENVRSATLPATRARLEALAAQHRAGSASLAAVLEARRALIEARLQELQLRAALAKARVALSYFSGERGHR